MRNLIKIFLILLLIPVGVFFILFLIPLFLILLILLPLFSRRQIRVFRWYNGGGFPGGSSPQNSPDEKSGDDACDVECTVIRSSIVDPSPAKQIPEDKNGNA